MSARGSIRMLIFAIIGVFIAGLMIGRTPEYLGKKIEAFEMKMSSIAILVMPFIVLWERRSRYRSTPAQASVANPGAHGFSEILYAFSSAANNNGSAFAGISANTPFYNTALGLAMWFGRFWPIVAVLAVAGSLAAKKRIPVSAGTMPTHGPTFVVLLSRHSVAGWRAHFRAGARPRADRRAPDPVGRLMPVQV